MEDIISDIDQGNPDSINGESCNERNYNDDLLETRSESDIPVRPPRPSKYGTKLFKNLSMDELGECHLSLFARKQLWGLRSGLIETSMPQRC